VKEELRPPRECQDCRVPMRLAHQGKFVRLYVCPQCGVRITVPPREPLTIANKQR